MLINKTHHSVSFSVCVRDICHHLIGLKMKDQPHIGCPLPQRPKSIVGTLTRPSRSPFGVTEENEIKYTAVLLDDYSLE